MKAIKVTKIEGGSTREKVDYPAEWGVNVVGLDEAIEFYEIQTLPKPVEYDVNKHNISETLTLTEDVGEFLKVCQVGWLLTDKTQSEVLTNFNNSFGTFIDDAYPLWRRVKDFAFPSDSGTLRQAQEASLRQERQTREDDYINNGVFPDFNFNWL